MNKQEFYDLVADEFGEPFAISYAERSGFTGGDNPVLYPWSLVANDKFSREARKFLQREGVRLGPPVCEHLKPKERKAA
jgi:hypothetical protein